MAQLGPIAGDSSGRQPRKLGQMSAQAKGVDWAQWWREWKAADRSIEAEFEATISRPIREARSRPRQKRHH